MLVPQEVHEVKIPEQVKQFEEQFVQEPPGTVLNWEFKHVVSGKQLLSLKTKLEKHSVHIPVILHTLQLEGHRMHKYPSETYPRGHELKQAGEAFKIGLMM